MNDALPPGMARVTNMLPVDEPILTWGIWFSVEYETAEGLRTTFLSPQRVSELRIGEAFLNETLVPIPTP
ncbi:hypothetical protein J8J14_24550 [Roseomonas sp. SSH11]|uniref:Uncharacterized protein n=1 Tax=Pararoseomonas baculiformis TaxID=2820812 RepID=A0ABS4ALK9_9PROT|nr:hypothetical protein [Pararoseomonas baculiformis]MBP0447902.1 hypothetical protein [Pararoseomonas baculiformis]